MKEVLRTDRPEAAASGGRQPPLRPGRRIRIAGLTISIALVAFLMGIPDFPPGGDPPVRRIVLITLDTTRREFLGAYGGTPGVTPHLDALAARGAVFNQAYAASSWTLPSHASVFTSLLPSRHGAHAAGLRGDSPGHPLPDSVPTLAEILRGAGYATGGFVGGPFLRTEFGLARGFDRYVQPDPRSHGDVSELLPQVFEWIRSVGDRPYFLFVNVFDPHAPYDPPPLASSTGAAAEEESPGRLRRYVPGKDPPPAARDIRSLRALYEAEIREADRGIGRLLAFLESRGDLDGDCLIAVTADHGEAFGENGHHGHGAPGYETQVHVPLLLFAPGRIPDGIEFDPVVETRWLFPTILESAGVDRPEGTEGENLAELAATGTAPARDVALVERFAGEMPHFTVRRGPYKYYRELRPGRAVERIVDLREDPEEVILFKPGKLRRLREIDPDRTERLERALRSLREVLDRHLAESVRTAGLLAAPPAAPPSREASSQALSPEARELLLRLGYLQGEDSNE